MPILASRQIRQQIAATRKSLKTLDRSLRQLASMVTAGTVNARRRPRLSAKARASLVLQGRYMGYMRQLSKKKKAQVRKIRETKGVKAAIAKAKSLSSE